MDKQFILNEDGHLKHNDTTIITCFVNDTAKAIEQMPGLFKHHKIACYELHIST